MTATWTPARHEEMRKWSNSPFQLEITRIELNALLDEVERLQQDKLLAAEGAKPCPCEDVRRLAALRMPPNGSLPLCHELEARGVCSYCAYAGRHRVEVCKNCNGPSNRKVQSDA